MFGLRLRDSGLVSSGSRRRMLASLMVVAVGLLVLASSASANDSWASGAPIPTARDSAAAAPVGNGDVLVTGGESNYSAINDSEIYDPTTGSWSSAAPLPQALDYAAAAPLPGGKVLVVGGDGGSGLTANTEIYDPVSDTWSAAAPLTGGPLELATAVALTDGSVLVTGGSTGGFNATSNSEIYDPNTNAWTAAAPIPNARYAAVGAPLPGGKVLVTSGYDGQNVMADSEIYDPTADSWSVATPIPAGREAAAGAALPGGKVLVTGGFTGSNFTADSEIYDTTADAWSQAAPIPGARYVAVAAPLADGTVLVTSGSSPFGGDLADTEIYGGSSPADTTMSLDCGVAKVMIGTPVTCSVLVTDTSSTPSDPTGSVRFSSNAPKATFTGNPCTLGDENSNSITGCQVSYTPTGTTSTVTANYGGDSGHGGSSAQATIYVSLRPTRTTFSCSQSSVALGGSTTCTATVVDSGPGQTSTPVGKVTFSGNKTDKFTNASPCTLTAVDNKTASCTTTYAPGTGPNKHSITAHYQSGGTHAGSSGSFAISVTKS